MSSGARVLVNGAAFSYLAGMDETVTIDQVLELARSNIERLTPVQALTAQSAGAVIVDIRPLEQRRRDGSIPEALVVDRNVLEWRLAPTSKWRLAEVVDRRVILVCNQGYQSSLAADSVRRLGVAGIADIIGGFEAWLAAALPIIDPTGPSPSR